MTSSELGAKAFIAMKKLKIEQIILDSVICIFSRETFSGVIGVKEYTF